VQGSVCLSERWRMDCRPVCEQGMDASLGRPGLAMAVRWAARLDAGMQASGEGCNAGPTIICRRGGICHYPCLPNTTGINDTISIVLNVIP
jgi:hypothetical protein